MIKVFLIILPISLSLLTAPAMAQKKQQKLALPQAMIGVWGEKAESCVGEATERNDRVEVEQGGIGNFVSIYGVRNWLRKGKVFSGRATLAEEGEGKPTPGRYPVALTLQADGTLKVELEKGHPAIYVKCPSGTHVR